MYYRDDVIVIIRFAADCSQYIDIIIFIVLSTRRQRELMIVRLRILRTGDVTVMLPTTTRGLRASPTGWKRKTRSATDRFYAAVRMPALCVCVRVLLFLSPGRPPPPLPPPPPPPPPPARQFRAHPRAPPRTTTTFPGFDRDRETAARFYPLIYIYIQFMIRYCNNYFIYIYI